MKRFVNLRIPALSACFLAAGVWLGYFLDFRGVNPVWLVAAVPVAAVFIILSFVKHRKIICVCALVFTAFLVCGALYSYFTLQNYRVCDVETEKTYVITGKVREKGRTDYGEYLIIDGAEADGLKLSGKVKVYLRDEYGDFCDEGYAVEFGAQLRFNDIYPYGELNRYAEDNIKYVCYPYGEIKSAYGFSFFGSIRSAIKNTLYGNLDYDTAAVCYGMLLGDTQNVDDEALESFRYGGIAHIFAVSGLHIGLVYGVLTFILKKFRANKYVSAILRVGAILFYAGICGFSVSAVRAVVTCAASTVAGLAYAKSDGLNNLGFAVALILFINPLSLFSVGFQLSVCAVVGILLLSGGIKRGLKRLKFPDKIAGGIGLTVGAQAGTLPVSLATFGYLSGAGLVLNLLIIPLVSVLFVLLFFRVLISLIVPPAAGFLIPYAALPLQGTLSFLLSANFERALITGFGAGAFVPIYFVAIFALSDKVNLKALSRGIAATFSVTLLSVCVLTLTFMPVNGYKVSVSAGANGGYALMKSARGNVLVMTEDASYYRLKSFLNREYSADLDAVVILGGDGCVGAYDSSLNCDTVFVCSLYIPVQPFRSVEVNYEKEFSVCGIDFCFTDGHSVHAEIDGLSVLIREDEAADESCDFLITLRADGGGNSSFYINDGKISG